VSVGLLLITHNDIGSSLLEAATRMLGRCPLKAETLAVTDETARELLAEQAQHMAEELDAGDGVLVLTDLFGSSPANIANALEGRCGLCVLAGVNLPMLVRILNYPALPLSEMVGKALSGGRDGVLLCPCRERKSR
jgi:PTS system ascorbate-specific IIA component